MKFSSISSPPFLTACIYSSFSTAWQANIYYDRLVVNRPAAGPKVPALEHHAPTSVAKPHEKDALFLEKQENASAQTNPTARQKSDPIPRFETTSVALKAALTETTSAKAGTQVDMTVAARERVAQVLSSSSSFSSSLLHRLCCCYFHIFSLFLF